MAAADWFGKIIEILKAIGIKIWGGITWPLRFASSWPDWVKGIIFGILVIAAILLGWYINKTIQKQEWRFIKS